MVVLEAKAETEQLGERVAPVELAAETQERPLLEVLEVPERGAGTAVRGQAAMVVQALRYTAKGQRFRKPTIR